MRMNFRQMNLMTLLRRITMANPKIKSLHEQVAADLIERLKNGTAPWQKPWDGSSQPFELPYNALTGKRYNGINIFSLLSAERADPRWMTFKQAASKEWQIRKGEKARLVQYVKTHNLVAKLDENGKKILDENGKPVKISVPLENALVTAAWVFNAEQIDGIPSLTKKVEPDSIWDPISRAEELVAKTEATILHIMGDRAFYNLATDTITMPLREQFPSADRYYGTILHEIAHWTGHKSRLDRSLFNRFGTEAYAREELRAEIASMLIGQELKIGHDPGQHAAYVKSWIQLLTDHPFEIHAAAADAEKILKFLLTFERKQDIKESYSNENRTDYAIPQTTKLKLFIGDQIEYNNNIFKVTGLLKKGRFRMVELNNGRSFTLSKSDALYGSLINCKQQLEITQSQSTDQNLNSLKEKTSQFRPKI